ncbi:hypothetical protein F0259_14495 [Vibrio cyclitrophicus]|nr:hypothetical protein F0Z19_4802 [Vibrio cyclitrophicus]OED97740.1 hypothetical protein OAO_16270 [Vibrio cyclitrophicus ZF28]OEE04288.1 hypothetical protein OC7_10625 [Vibrio cyclitrophicus ZF270]OEE21975.1 hypothetical protein OAM_22440 [Vibrio cyclitrophicus ZF14]OEF40927.1 hypothetical protein OAE_20440 [Vibrio cyclitrophicus 1F289]
MGALSFWIVLNYARPLSVNQHKSLLFLAYAVGLNSGNLESFKSVNFNYVLVLTISLYYSLEPDTC